MDKKLIKILTVAAVFVLILNMILLATNKINELIFWIIIYARKTFRKTKSLFGLRTNIRILTKVNTPSARSSVGLMPMA